MERLRSHTAVFIFAVWPHPRSVAMPSLPFFHDGTVATWHGDSTAGMADMIGWIYSIDGTQILLSIKYSAKFPELFHHMNGLAKSVLECDIQHISLGSEASRWPQSLRSLLQNGADGFLGRCPSGTAPGAAAIGIATNKRNRTRACGLAMLLTAGMPGVLPGDEWTHAPLQLEHWAPGPCIIYEAARSSCPGSAVRHQQLALTDTAFRPESPKAATPCPPPYPGEEAKEAERAARKQQLGKSSLTVAAALGSKKWVLVQQPEPTAPPLAAAELPVQAAPSIIKHLLSKNRRFTEAKATSSLVVVALVLVVLVLVL